MEPRPAGGARPGRRLALVSHLDTVPVGDGWVREPFQATIETGKLYGRGSGDAKASVAAMLLAARDVVADTSAMNGELVVILGYGEETRHTSMPEALARTLEITDACRFSLDELRYEYPIDPAPAGMSEQAYLEELTWAGAAERYPGGIPARSSAARRFCNRFRSRPPGR